MTTKPPRTQHTLVEGDDWRALLECRKPGETFLVVEMSGKREANVPIDNVLKAHVQLDEGADAEQQRQIQALRTEVGDWKSKYYDQVGNEATISQLRDEISEEMRKRLTAEAELAHVRATMPPRGAAPVDDLESRTKAALVVVQLRVLERAARALAERCGRCGGTHAVDGVPCPVCSTVVELLQELEKGRT